MSDKLCDFYVPWHHHGVAINQCFDYFRGYCWAELSPNYKSPCPFPNGYPREPRRDHPAPLKELEHCGTCPIWQASMEPAPLTTPFPAQEEVK